MYTSTDSASLESDLTPRLQEAVAKLSRELYAQYALRFPRLAADLLEVLVVAEAEAWDSAFPHLLLPGLMEVKVAQLLLPEEAALETDAWTLALAA